MASEEKKTGSPLLGRLNELIEPVVLGLGLELADLQFRREAHGWVLRIILDGEQGISVEDCAEVSRDVGHLLEVEDPIEQAYTLEVSSPGLDRPLKQEKDFCRAKGKTAKIVVRDAVAGRHSFIGEILAAGDGMVTVASEDGPVEIPLAAVKKARLVVEF